MTKTYLFGHTDEDSAYIIEDYPYGWNYRTQMRVWIETTNRGDRICRQTLNPKTNKWNKPKKSTYSAVEVMFRNEENGHISAGGFSLGWSDEKAITTFLDEIGGMEKLNERQISKVKDGIAISRTQEHVTVEIKASEVGPVSLTDRSPENLAKMEKIKEEQEAHKKEQAEAKKNISKLYAYNRAKLD